MSKKYNGWNNNLTPSEGIGGKPPFDNFKDLNPQPMTTDQQPTIEGTLDKYLGNYFINVSVEHEGEMGALRSQIFKAMTEWATLSCKELEERVRELEGDLIESRHHFDVMVGNDERQAKIINEKVEIINRQYKENESCHRSIEQQTLQLSDKDKVAESWKEECYRLAGVAEFWQAEYNKILYEQNKNLPGFNNPKLENL